jgi:hypothetical protein
MSFKNVSKITIKRSSTLELLNACLVWILGKVNTSKQ